MPDAPRRLVVARHARAEPAATTDAARRLTGSGRADARAAGAWLAGPDGLASAVPHALVSSAARTVDTWDELAGSAGWSVEARVEDGLYVAGPDAALDLVRETPADVATLVVVGHNPTMGYLAQLLDAGDGPGEAATRMLQAGFPTCALALFDVDVAWADLAPGTARLAAFHVGRADEDPAD